VINYSRLIAVALL